MSEHDKPAAGAGERPARGGDLVIPVLATAFTLYYFWSIQDAPWTAKVSTYFVGSVLFVLVALFLGRTLLDVLRGRVSLGLGRLVAPVDLLWRRAALMGVTIGYVMVLEHGGFTITTSVYLFVSMLLLGGLEIARRALLVSLVYALGGYLLFIAAFQTRFPAGPFEQLMKELF